MTTKITTEEAELMANALLAQLKLWDYEYEKGRTVVDRSTYNGSYYALMKLDDRFPELEAWEKEDYVPHKM